MTVAQLVPKKPDPRFVEMLEHQLERARNGEIDSLLIITCGNGVMYRTYLGDEMALVYGIESMKLAMLADD